MSTGAAARRAGERGRAAERPRPRGERTSSPGMRAAGTSVAKVASVCASNETS
jgi:hypothetical protein